MNIVEINDDIYKKRKISLSKNDKPFYELDFMFTTT